MFDAFSFDSPRSPSFASDSTLTQTTSRSISPCSAQSPFPPPAFTVTDLAAKFGGQRIRKDSSICYDPCEAYANNDDVDDDFAWSLPPLTDLTDHRRSSVVDNDPVLSRAAHTLQRPYSPSRRLARQVNTRLLCTAAHQKDIADLVAHMVQRDQCNLLLPPSPSAQPLQLPLPPSPTEDEGYDSGDASVGGGGSRRSSGIVVVMAAAASTTVGSSSRPHRLDYRRASDLNKTASCISKKPVRLRKDRDPTRRRPAATAAK